MAGDPLQPVLRDEATGYLVDKILPYTPTRANLLPTAAAVTALANSGTIPSSSGLSACTTSGAVTGAIIAAGTYEGQTLIVVNASANSITAAASGTSNVADGTSCVIAANRAVEFFWSAASGTGLWYRTG